MIATSTENHAPSDATGGHFPLNDDPIVLLLYGEEYVNLALADELALDGYEVRRASDAAKLRSECSEWEVEHAGSPAHPAAKRQTTVLAADVESS